MNASSKMGLVINAEKIKFLISTNKTPMKTLANTFKMLKQFMYLETLISCCNDLRIEIKNRIFMANRSFYGLRKQFNSKFISVSTKLNIDKILIRPIDLYRSECETLNKEKKKSYSFFERKILCKVF